MSYHQDIDNSALSHISRKPKKCGICYKVFTQHLSRHFRKVHPGKQPCEALLISDNGYMIIPLKEKIPSSGINIEDQPNN